MATMLLQSHRQPPRVRHVRGVDQRLDLDQQRSRAFLGDQHARARHRAGVLRQEQQIAADLGLLGEKLLQQRRRSALDVHAPAEELDVIFQFGMPLQLAGAFLTAA